MSARTSPAPPAPGRRLRPQRARTLVVAAALATAYTLLRAGFAPAADTVLAIGVRLADLAVAMTALLALAGIVHAFRRAYVSRWHHRLQGAARTFIRLARLPRRERPSVPETAPLAAGDRVGLVLGVLLVALDVVLTTLLLRDVFPTAPYHVPLFGEFGHEWGFYVLVSAFKTAIEVWFGLLSVGRAASWRAGLFVLGAASAFDAALAVARGLVLAQQGLSGPMVMTSNLLFISFGIAVPWVAAYTGYRLALAVDPWLARVGFLSLLFAIPRYLLLGLAWCCALAIGLVLGFTLGTLAIAGSIWFALESIVGLVLGHEDDPRIDFAPFVAARPDPTQPDPDVETTAIGRFGLGGAQ